MSFLYIARFGNDLQISDKLFVLDAGASGSKEMKLLRNHLQELRGQLISVSHWLFIDLSGIGGFGVIIYTEPYRNRICYLRPSPH